MRKKSTTVSQRKTLRIDATGFLERPKSALSKGQRVFVRRKIAELKAA